MDKFSIFLAIFGAFGIGTGGWGILQQFLSNRQERNKILFNKKLDAYSDVCEIVIGLGVTKKSTRNPYENQATCAKARLLIRDKDLDRRIHGFFISLDDLIQERINSVVMNTETSAKFKELQKTGYEIVDSLGEDLNKTI